MVYPTKCLQISWMIAFAISSSRSPPGTSVMQATHYFRIYITPRAFSATAYESLMRGERGPQATITAIAIQIRLIILTTRILPGMRLLMLETFIIGSPDYLRRFLNPLCKCWLPALTPKTTKPYGIKSEIYLPRGSTMLLRRSILSLCLSVHVASLYRVCLYVCFAVYVF